MDMFYKVRLSNNSIDDSTAEIVPYTTDNSVTLAVYSANVKMKQHLEELVMQEAYIMSPGRSTTRMSPDGVLHLYPYTLDYLQALPEILSWRGYTAEFSDETHKSIDYLDFTMKAVDGNIYTNAEGERIVKVVPQGFIAVHTDGRIVAAGRWLNANIDKEDAQWVLEENPYENMNPEQRDASKEYMDLFLEDYHPGVQEELYKRRETDSDEYYQEEDYKPSSGKRLSEIFPVEQEIVSEEGKEARNLPINIPPGKILYSPNSGYALASELWPPTSIEGYEKMRWYVFNDVEMEDDEKKAYADMLGISSPQMAVGLKDGVVQLEPDLDISEGFRLSIPGFSTSDVIINTPEFSKLKPEELDSPEYKKAARLAADKLNAIKNLVKYRDSETGQATLHPDIEDFEIEDLQGTEANFAAELYPHQKVGVAVLTETSQYEAFGGPKGWHGHFLSSYYGSGKTAMVLASDTIMRNKGLFKTGEQVTIITAPNKNTYVWREEIGKFRDEAAVIIDGDRQNRVEQWEDLLAKARTGTLPSFVILGASSFRFSKSKEIEDEWELGTDAQYMKLLSLGGSSKDEAVKGGHIAALVLDESGQYVNPESARHKAVIEMTDSVYQGKGVTWTLNGDMSGNSSTDTISEIAFINKLVRDNYNQYSNDYTKAETSGRGSRRIWKNGNFLLKFMNSFRPQIFSLDGKTVVGDEWGLTRTEDVGASLGANWGEVYNRAWAKLVNASAEKQMHKALGVMQILINASLGAVPPARLIEYDLGVEKLISSVKKIIPPTEYASFREGVMRYQQLASQTTPLMGRIAISEDMNQRDATFRQCFSDSQISAMEIALRGWNSPIIDSFAETIDKRLVSHEAGKNCKIGVNSFSKTFLNALAVKLREKYQDKVLVQIVDGDTDAEEVNNIQQRHQNEKDKSVITLYTHAGSYGLSFPADYCIRTPTWNSAKAGQGEGRTHRDARQKTLVTVAQPDGICQYMRELEQTKREREQETRGVAVLDIDDSGDDIKISKMDGSLIAKLAQFKPRVQVEEVE